MARRNTDFRPDRMERSLFDRLYVTRLQRQSLLKWALYAAVVLVCLILQDVVLCRVSILGATTDLVPCAILLVCLVQDVDSGCIFTLIASFLYVFSGSAPGYHVPFLLTGLGALVSIFRQSYLRKGFSATILCAAMAIMAYEVVIFAVCLVFQQTYPARFFLFMLRGAYTVLAAPLLYPFVRGISKIGGESWKE